MDPLEPLEPLEPQEPVPELPELPELIPLPPASIPMIPEVTPSRLNQFKSATTEFTLTFFKSVAGDRPAQAGFFHFYAEDGSILFAVRLGDSTFNPSNSEIQTWLDTHGPFPVPSHFPVYYLEIHPNWRVKILAQTMF